MHGSGSRWSLRSGDEDLAVFRTNYRAGFVRCDLAAGSTLGFHTPRGTAVTARRDGSIEVAATYRPKMRGGIVRVGGGPPLRLKPAAFSDRWALRDGRRTIMAVDVTSTGTLATLLTEAAGTERDLPLLVSLAVTALILERSVGRGSGSKFISWA